MDASSCARSGPATTRCCSSSRRDVVTRPSDRERTAAEARLHYFLINKGPWSRLDHNQPFVPGVPAKPEAANFYPAGATKDEVEKWIDGLTRRREGAATGFFTTIRRGPAGLHGRAVHVEYQGELARRRRAPARGGGARRRSRRSRSS